MGSIRVVPTQNNNSYSSVYGQWFFRVFHNQPFDVVELAKHISNDSKVERAKVVSITQAVLKQIAELLCNGHPIRIPHLGMLKLGVSSKGADSIQEYNARTDIKDLHIVMVPDKEIKQALREMKFIKYFTEQKKPNGTTTTGGETPENPGGENVGG